MTSPPQAQFLGRNIETAGQNQPQCSMGDDETPAVVLETTAVGALGLPSDRIRDSLATVAGGPSSGTVQTSTPGASMPSVTAEMSLDQAGEQVELLDVAGPLHELHTTGVPGELVEQGMVQAGAGTEAAERYECRLLG